MPHRISPIIALSEIGGCRGDMNNLVAKFIEVLLSAQDAEPDELVELLGLQHIDAATAEVLIAFVPIAFSHVLLNDMGVKLPTTFKAIDLETQQHVSGVLVDEPVYAAALSLAKDWENVPEMHDTFLVIAQSSAEWDVIQQLTCDGSAAAGCELTESMLVRVPLSYFRKRHSFQYGRG